MQFIKALTLQSVSSGLDGPSNKVMTAAPKQWHRLKNHLLVPTFLMPGCMACCNESDKGGILIQQRQPVNPTELQLLAKFVSDKHMQALRTAVIRAGLKYVGP